MISTNKRGKNMRIFLVLLLALLIRCNENPVSNSTDESQIPVTIQNLSGQWEWIKSVDSLNQIVDNPNNSYKRTISITQDYYFSEYRNDTLISKYSFCIKKAMTTNSTDSLCYLDRLDNSKYFNCVIFSLTSKALVIGYALPGSSKRVFSRSN